MRSRKSMEHKIQVAISFVLIFLIEFGNSSEQEQEINDNHIRWNAHQK